MNIFGEEKCNLTSLLTIVVIIPYFTVRGVKKLI